MAIRTIRTEGDEILRKKSKKVEVIDKNKLGKAKEIISVIPKGFESDYLYL